MEYTLFLEKKMRQKKAQAKTRGLEFSLTLFQFQALYECRVCFYTGIELVQGTKPGNPVPPNAWTLDRVDNTLGYIPGNVVVCSFAANQVKELCFDQVATSRVDPVIYNCIKEKLFLRSRVTISQDNIWTRLKKAWAIIVAR